MRKRRWVRWSWWTIGTAAAAFGLFAAAAATGYLARPVSTAAAYAGNDLPNVANRPARNGMTAVGALFQRTNGRLAGHFCSASVVHSRAGNLIITAAHCLAGMRLGPAGDVVFAPDYRDGRFPLGVWTVTRMYVTKRWAASHDPDDDVAFLVVSSGHRRLERLAGAERIGIDARVPVPVTVVGYPGTGSRPISCTAPAWPYRTAAMSQLVFDCDGFTDGTSGGPFLRAVSRAGYGTVIGVIGGYQQGGDTPAVSYSPRFGRAVASLYHAAARG